MTARRLLASTLATTFVAGAALAPAADARVTRPFDLYTSATKSAGRAHVYGEVTFLKNGNVRVKGKINDNCPEDGYGAYVHFHGSHLGNDLLWTGFKDIRGCSKATAVPFSFRTRRTQSYQRVDEVLIQLKEVDQDSRTVGDENTFLVTRK